MSRLIAPPSLNVIDSATWLRERVEALVSTGESEQAIGYLHRLQASTEDEATRLYCHSYLGILYLISEDVARARAALAEANRLSPREPYIAYALGHCQSSHNDWQATLYFFEAIHLAASPHDRAEFMRSAALSVQRLGLTEMAHAMMLGALDRDLGNPWILDALARLYEQEGMWMETLDILDGLIAALASATSAMVVRTTPSVGQLLRNALLGDPAGEQALRKRTRAINARLRANIDLVYGEHDRRLLEHTGLAPTNLPNALHILVRELGLRERSYQLLESAQSLWARARHERFDVFLTPNTLAASIHWLVERLHWRIPTPATELTTRYGVEAETTRAAARILAERFKIRFLPQRPDNAGLDATEAERLDRIQRALLLDVDLSSFDTTVAMLGS
ncbi:MAG: hypothetical protein H0U74_05025 [Bradymonadaceae bacterium]|nr:hypothetical protein [Lujinxingiaceae bacterium]